MCVGEQDRQCVFSYENFRARELSVPLYLWMLPDLPDLGTGSGAAEGWTGAYCLLSDRMVECDGPGVPLALRQPQTCWNQPDAARTQQLPGLRLCIYIQLKVC